jgi:transposase
MASMPSKRPNYSPEFRAEAVKLVLSGQRTAAEAAASLGVNPYTLRKWLARARVDHSQKEGMSTVEQEELRKLRRENRVLKEEREILAKAAAFFAHKGEQNR